MQHWAYNVPDTLICNANLQDIFSINTWWPALELGTGVYVSVGINYSFFLDKSETTLDYIGSWAELSDIKLYVLVNLFCDIQVDKR
jgi:hypothetical protein